MGLTAKRKVSAFLLALFLELQILAAFPVLHALIHPDCNNPTHHCGVTLFLHGQVDSSNATVAVVLTPPATVPHEIFCKSPFISRDKPVQPGRGPPSLS
jgi:hypothetical protein